MRIIKRIGLALAALGSVVLVIAVGLIVADRIAQPPPPDLRALIARGDAYHVRIRRDDYGVPHVRGATDADVAFGLGFAQSEDDFATVQDVALATRGTQAAWKGKDGAVADYLVRLMRVNQTVDAGYPKLPADVRGVLQAYADGVNAYGARHPDTYRAVHGEAQSDGRLKARGGDTLIMFVTWDKSGTLSSQSIHRFGSATLDAASPHYADQTPLFAAMKTKPVWFTEGQLA